MNSRTPSCYEARTGSERIYLFKTLPIPRRSEISPVPRDTTLTIGKMRLLSVESWVARLFVEVSRVIGPAFVSSINV